MQQSQKPFSPLYVYQVNEALTLLHWAALIKRVQRPTDHRHANGQPSCNRKSWRRWICLEWVKVSAQEIAAKQSRKSVRTGISAGWSTCRRAPSRRMCGGTPRSVSWRAKGTVANGLYLETAKARAGKTLEQKRDI